ncbi:putative acyl-CoA synthetase [Cavenderia fasciculata]|uniref:Acyl-CoA synthetase n=1 Tax=Cavenderia fasciculata TaxID=261658 RepID=F4PUK1_CACFS|nr:putative acyl-CoA synthetase [Cavenderia fasciculata]EGG21865.1 putative acyl-CoA synthetase [Cavenderia fasciculata]|eukprot:XP_004359716.1 putative acyl-CoA synthetase [Cavenderia fasciculata]
MNECHQLYPLQGTTQNVGRLSSSLKATTTVLSSSSSSSSSSTKRCYISSSSSSSSSSSTKHKYTSGPDNYSYDHDFKNAMDNNEQFWNENASNYVHWDKKYDKTLGGTPEYPKWFEGGLLNAAYNALDVHVKNPKIKNKVALVHETPSVGIVHKLTYEQLYDEVCLFSTALINLGIQKGDHVIIYMPMINASVVAMLACARIGATHSVVFGGFASPQLANRIDHLQPKLIISANFGVEGKKFNHYTLLLQKALELAQHKPAHTIVYTRKDIVPDVPSPKIQGALDWHEITKAVQHLSRDYAKVDSQHPLFILYTSGTTGSPKGLVRETGGYVAAVNYAMRHTYDMKAGEDTFFAASDIGWIVGHTGTVYGSLCCGLTSIVFEGKPIIPDAGVVWNLIEKHRVNAMFTAPTAVRAIHAADPDGKLIKKHDLSSLRSIWLGGEKLDSATYSFLTDSTKTPVYDNYWNTESGWPMITNPCGKKKIVPGVTGIPVPGYNFHILDENGQRIIKPDTTGELAIKLPIPPGFSPTLFKNHDGYVNTYLRRYKGYMRSGDSAFITKDGYYNIVSRVDDVINVSGHRLSTGSIEEVLSSHPAVVESAVIGVHDDIKGEVPFGLIVVKPNYSQAHHHEQIEKDMIKAVREKIGPVATFKQVLVVKRLPKTRSGKILRAILRKIYHGEPFPMPPTIEDPEVLNEIELNFKQYHQSHPNNNNNNNN